MSPTLATTAHDHIRARLWSAAAREPLPGIAKRHFDRSGLTITTTSGHTLHGPGQLQPFLDAELTTTIDGASTRDPHTLAALLVGDNPHSDQLLSHIDESIIGLQHAHAAAQPHPRPGQLLMQARTHHTDSSVYFEQLVLDGHPLHPLCRTRENLTPAQQRRYAPEHRPQLAVPLIALPHAHVNGHWPWRDAQSRPLLPVHPLQAQGDHATSLHQLAATPLMSLRTLALNHQPFHIKTALPIQMTSAIRQVSPAAVHNGPRLSRLLQQLADHTRLTIQPEIASLAGDHNGHPDPHRAAIVRPNIGSLIPHTDIATPTAALASRDPATAKPLISAFITASAHTPTSWWKHATSILIHEPLRLLSTYGIALEAHGQNTLLVTRDAAPHHAIYRDFGGVRIDPHQLHRHHPQIDLAGDIATPNDPDVLHTKLIASLFSVAIYQLIDALTRHYQDHPDTYWKHVANTVNDSTIDTTLKDRLYAPDWPIKATTAMRLQDTPTADIWASIPNPIKHLG